MIWEKVCLALQPLNVPMAADRFVPANGSELPDVYLVYRLISSPAQQHADNQETLRMYRVQISIYSRTGLDQLPDVDNAMKAAGFQPSSARGLPYNEPSRHFGLAKDYVFVA